jgi:hypothetical protein
LAMFPASKVITLFIRQIITAHKVLTGFDPCNIYDLFFKKLLRSG